MPLSLSLSLFFFCSDVSRQIISASPLQSSSYAFVVFIAKSAKASFPLSSLCEISASFHFCVFSRNIWVFSRRGFDPLAFQSRPLSIRPRLTQKDFPRANFLHRPDFSPRRSLSVRGHAESYLDCSFPLLFILQSRDRIGITDTGKVPVFLG